VSAATPEPADGHIARDATGKPTGIFEDGGHRALAAAFPPSSPDENVKMAQAALDALRRQGVTTFLDAAAAPDSLAAFAAVAGAGGLTARAHFAPVIEAQAAEQPAAVITALKATIARYDSGAIGVRPGITVRNAKIFMDGVLQAPAQTAVLLAPYRVDQGTPSHPHWVPGTKTGEPYFAQDVLNPMLVALAEAGIDPHIHAIGDRAVHQALDGIEVMRQAVPGADVRAAIAHAEMVDPADYGRFARLDAIPVMSFQWAKPGPDSIDAARDYLGPVRFARMEPEGSLYAAHARIAYGSDWPVDRLDEWFALKVGITRTGDPALGARYAGRLNAEKDLPRAAALRAITANAAYELHQDAETGSLEAGKLADLIVLDRDVLTLPAARIAQTRVLLTMVGGSIVYRADGF
jgi:predicted amidohydrolase YtcJ